MRVFLKHTRTGYYYRGRSEWAAEEIDAGNFENIEMALRMIIRDKLDGMSLVICYDDKGAKQVFDLSEETPLINPPTSNARPKR